MSVDVLVLGTADWNQPIATNQHYIATALSGAAEVTFVESLGLRRPSLSSRDLRRVWRRLRSRPANLAAGRPVPGSMRVVSPRVIPLHNRATAAINRRLLSSSVRDWVASESSGKVLWCYSPVTYGLERHANATVYHCVDLLGEVPGIDEALIHAAETALADCGAVAIGTSRRVVSHLQDAGFSEIIYWPNVADSTVFASAAEIHGRRRAAVFAGNLTESKVDFGLLDAIVESGFELHIAGPISEGGGNAKARVDSLVAAGAAYHGMLTPEGLADLFGSCSVGLIPYVFNRYTDGVSPLKTYEYLAAGLSVISLGVPSVEPLEGDVFVTRDHTEFVDILMRQPIPDSAARARRLGIADLNSWERRAEEARELLRTLGRSG